LEATATGDEHASRPSFATRPIEPQLLRGLTPVHDAHVNGGYSGPERRSGKDRRTGDDRRKKGRDRQDGDRRSGKDRRSGEERREKDR
jgi:hypothetical protein